MTEQYRTFLDVEKNPTKTAMTGLLLLTGTGVASFILSGRAGTLAGLLTTVYCGVGVLVAVLSFLLMRHYRAEEVERL